MGTLIGLMKALICAAFLDRVVKDAIIAGLVKSMSWVLRPSKGSIIGNIMISLFPMANGSIRRGYIQALLKSILAAVLLRSMNRSGLALPVIIATAGAFLLSLIEPRAKQQERGNRIIDIDEFTVMDEVQ